MRRVELELEGINKLVGGTRVQFYCIHSRVCAGGVAVGSRDTDASWDILFLIGYKL